MMGPKVAAPHPPGTVVATKGGTRYVVTDVVSTLRRETPKVKGKKARKAERLARRRLREGVPD